MNSRITIDVNEANQPIIKVRYRDTEDVRDKLVKKFIEGLQGSAWCRVQFVTGLDGKQDLDIRPLTFDSLETEAREIEKWIK